MSSTKVNLYISFTPEDKPQLDKLLRWLYPMRDEVNIWYNHPPDGPEPFPLPWQLLLFWYRQPDPRRWYARKLKAQSERAHIYLFLTSYKSLSDARMEEEITTAVSRHIEFGAKFIRVFPVLLAPSHWKVHSRLAQFRTLGPRRPLAQMEPEEEGYLELVDQLKREINAVQRNLDELNFARSRPNQLSLGAGSAAWPALLEETQATDFEAPQVNAPPEWLGWSIIFILLISVFSSLSPRLPSPATRRFQNVEPPGQRPPEFRREFPLMPPPDTLLPPKPDTL